MNKKIGVILLLSTFLLLGCNSYGSEIVNGSAKNPSKQVITTQPKQDSTKKITWSSKNNEVRLTPVKVSKYGYDGVTVQVNNVKKKFDWSFHSLDEPQVLYADVTGDGNKEAVIMMNIGKGTGLSINEIHVLNSKDLSEIKVQNYEEIVAERIETHVTNHGGKLAIQVKAQGKETKFSYDSGLQDLNQDKLYFGGIVYYQLEKQKITSMLAASVGISPEYVCDIHITYKYEKAKNEFIAEKIEVIPNAN